MCYRKFRKNEKTISITIAWKEILHLKFFYIQDDCFSNICLNSWV